MKLRDLVSALRRRIAPSRVKVRERKKNENESEPDVTDVLGPTGGQLGNPQRF
jgi:hypothetical protein